MLETTTKNNTIPTKMLLVSGKDYPTLSPCPTAKIVFVKKDLFKKLTLLYHLWQMKSYRLK